MWVPIGTFSKSVGALAPVAPMLTRALLGGGFYVAHFWISRKLYLEPLSHAFSPCVGFAERVCILNALWIDLPILLFVEGCNSNDELATELETESGAAVMTLKSVEVSSQKLRLPRLICEMSV